MTSGDECNTLCHLFTLTAPSTQIIWAPWLRWHNVYFFVLGLLLPQSIKDQEPMAKHQGPRSKNRETENQGPPRSPSHDMRQLFESPASEHFVYTVGNSFVCFVADNFGRRKLQWLRTLFPETSPAESASRTKTQLQHGCCRDGIPMNETNWHSTKSWEGAKYISQNTMKQQI